MKNTFMIIVVCACCTCLFCTAYGQPTWTKMNDAYYAFDPRDMSVAKDGVIYAIGGSSHELVKSTNQGTSWTHLGQYNAYCVGVKPTNSLIVLVGIDSTSLGGSIKVRRSGDGGVTWTDVIRPVQEGMATRANRIAFHPVRPESVLVGCVEGTWSPTTFQIFRSINGGQTFQGMTGTNAKKLRTITDIVIDGSTAAGIGYVTGSTATGTTTDQGVWRSTAPFTITTSWTLRNSGLVNKNIGAIAVDPALNTRLFCATSENVGSDVFTTYITTNSGTTWLQTNSSSSPSNNKVRDMIIASSNIYLGTILGIWTSPTGINPIYTKSTGAGFLDTYCQSLGTYTSGATTYLFCGTAGTFYRSTDAAANWTESDSLMASASPLAIAKRGSTMYIINAATGVPGSLVHRSTNGGTTWTVVMNNIDSLTWNYLEGSDIAIKPNDVNSAIFSGRVTGNAGPRVYRTTNTGTKWLAAYTPTASGTANQIAYDVVDPNKVYVAAQNLSLSPNGRILKSIDAGVSFDPRAVATVSLEMKSVVVNPIVNSILYSGGTTTNMYKSTDYGATWFSSATGLPANSTINSIAVDPNQTPTVYTATGAGTYMSFDNGATWTLVTHQSSTNVKSILLHPNNSSCSYQITGTTGGFLRKNALTGLDGPWSTAWTDETDGLLVPFRKVIIDPTDIFHLFAATSDGIYIKTHQWDGYLNANTVWSATADIQIGSSTVVFGMNNTLRLDAYGSLPATLTINAGATVKFLLDAQMYARGACSISAVGMAGNIISFTPLNPASETWGGIQISDGVATGTFQYCDFYENTSGVTITSSAASTIKYCTFRECLLGYGYSQVNSTSVLAKKNRVTGTNVHGQGVYIFGSTFAMDSCYISGQQFGIQILGGAPGFRADTIESNGNPSWGARFGGVFCQSNSSPKFGGWAGTEPGNNIIRNNDSTQVLSDSSTVLLGDSVVGTGQVAGNNTITDNAGRRRVSAVHHSTVKAQFCTWNASCPPPASLFYTDATSSINTSNCLGLGIVVLISPINNQTVPKPGVIFYWHKASWSGGGAVLYHFEEDTDSTFANPYMLERNYDNVSDTFWNASSGFQTSGPHYWRVMPKNPALGIDGSWSQVGYFIVNTSKALSDDLSNGSKPTVYQLGQNYPNPFNPVTTIDYDLPEEGHVKIIVFDVLGKEVEMLVDEFQAAGSKSIAFDGSRLPSGVYFYRIQAGRFSDIKKMILTK